MNVIVKSGGQLHLTSLYPFLCSCWGGDVAEVRLDALTVNVSLSRGQILANCQHKSRAVMQLIHALYEPFSVSPAIHKERG